MFEALIKQMNESQNNTGKHYYFNITYACNSQCVFCAADLTRTGESKNPNIALADFLNLLDQQNISSNDTVTINGGEPTVHKEFYAILKAVKAHGSRLVLFTNGRAFASTEFADRLRAIAPLEILVPIYSFDECIHDAFTGVAGSLKQTMAGIGNIFDLQESGVPVSVEFRLLLSRHTIAHALSVAKRLSADYSNREFTISINPLIVSECARAGDHAISLQSQVPTIKELFEEIKSAGHKVIFNSYPSCIKWQISPELALSDATIKKEEGYFDPYFRESITPTHPRRFLAASCKICELLEYCPGFPPGHLEIIGEKDARPVTEADHISEASNALHKFIKATDVIDLENSVHVQTVDGRSIWIEPSTGSWYLPKDPSLTTKVYESNGISIKELQRSSPQNATTFASEVLLAGIGRSNGKRFTSDKLFVREPSGLSTLILNYTRRCNMDCEYCYADGNQPASDMPNQMVIDILERLEPVLAPSVDIILHGGEPLLRVADMGNLVEMLNQHGLSSRVTIGIQTNATLINEDVAEFLVKNNIGVGVSIDSSELRGNSHRLLPDGRSSLDRALRGIFNLLSVGLKPGIISVISPRNVDSILDSLRFFYEVGLRDFVLNPIFAGGSSKKILPVTNINETSTLDMLLSVLKWINDTNSKNPFDRVNERNLSTLIEHITSYKRTFMCAQAPCGACRHTLAVDFDGSVYPCDDFVSVPEFRMDSIYNVVDAKDFITNHPVAEPFLGRRNKSPDACVECVWQAICTARCASESYFASGDIMHEGLLCETMKHLIPETISLLAKGRIKKRNIMRNSLSDAKVINYEQSKLESI